MIYGLNIQLFNIYGNPQCGFHTLLAEKKGELQQPVLQLVQLQNDCKYFKYTAACLVAKYIANA